MASWLHDFIYGSEQQATSVWTLVHVLFGFICFWIGISFGVTFGIGIAWELIENSIYGLSMFSWIYEYYGSLTHGKEVWPNYWGDSIGNSYSDFLGVGIGWMFGYGCYHLGRVSPLTSKTHPSNEDQCRDNRVDCVMPPPPR